MSTLTRIALLVGLVALAVMTGRATDPQPTPTTAAVAAHTTTTTPVTVAQAGQGTQGQPEGYTCTSPSSCAVLAAALGGTDEDPDPAHDYTRGNAPDEQPRAHTQRRSTAQHEDQPGWNCARQGNHVCGDGVAGGPTASGGCPAGGVRVYGTPHGCRYR